MLNIMGTPLSGTVSTDFAQSTIKMMISGGMLYLTLAQTRLSGTLHGTVPSAPRLPNTAVDHNTGSAPRRFNTTATSQPKYSVMMFETALSGTLMAAFQYAHLNDFLMHDTEISGTIPVFSNVIQRVSFSNMQLSGELPASTAPLSWLSLLSIYNNPRLEGSLEMLGTLATLKHFFAFGCSISGSIPGNLSSGLEKNNTLESLLVRSNSISGYLDTVGSIETLNNLDVSSNRISGSLNTDIFVQSL